MESLVSPLSADAGVRVLGTVPGTPQTVLVEDTDENKAMYKDTANAAREAGVSARDPIKLLSFAQSAMALDDPSEHYNVKLRYALEEIKGVVTVSDYSSLAVNLQTLTFENRRTFLWETFKLCCTYLSRPGVLDGHPLRRNLAIAPDRGVMNVKTDLHVPPGRSP